MEDKLRALSKNGDTIPARIGILGGTFDPVHLGHINMAEAALREAGLDEIWMMPAYIQPFKKDRYVAYPEDRIKMLELASSHEERIIVSTWEIQRQRISYTFDTINSIRREHPDDKLFFMMGSDAFLKIEAWRNAIDIIKKCSIAVGLRPNNDRKIVKKYAEHLTEEYGTEVIILEKEMLNISSTIVRERIERGQSISDLVSPLVEEYIYDHKLYV